jgi:adenylate kinase
LRSQIAAETELGRVAQSYVQSGELVPDEVVLDLMLPPIQEAAAAGGYVLDGFPRSLHQAEEGYKRALDLQVTADVVVYLAVPDEVVRERIAARAGAGSRKDDADSEVIERRLRVFHSETEPLLDYYRGRGLLVTVDASGTPEEVTEAMMSALESRRSSG